MKELTLGEVIAERQFEATDESGKENEVLVRIGKPVPDSTPGGDWCCPYQVLGIGREPLSAAYGVDSMQALMLCFKKIAADLNYYCKANRVRLTWLDQDELWL
jgi:hypothetical protein